MANRWMRFNYTDPVPCIDTITGKKTGKSMIYLRAVRSDNFMYLVQGVVSDIEPLTGSYINEIHAQMRKDLDVYLEDEPHVAPMPQQDPFKGVENWMEAIIH